MQSAGSAEQFWLAVVESETLVLDLASGQPLQKATGLYIRLRTTRSLARLARATAVLCSAAADRVHFVQSPLAIVHPLPRVRGGQVAAPERLRCATSPFGWQQT